MLEATFIALLVVVVVASVAAATNNQAKPEPNYQYTQPFTHDVPRQEAKIDFNLLRHKHLNSKSKLDYTFSHSKELIASLLSKNKKLVVNENQELDADSGRRLTFEEIAAQNSFKLHAEYTLFEEAAYHVLDDLQELESVKNIGLNSMEYCGKVTVGDFFVGGRDGPILTHENGKEWMKYADFDEGELLFSRQVISVNDVTRSEGRSCYRIGTKMVFPQQLFAHFRLTSHSELPTTHHYHPKSMINPETYPGGGPNSPGYACTNTDIFLHDDFQNVSIGANDDFQVHTYGEMAYSTCLSLTKNVGQYVGANFQYNFCPSSSGSPEACASIPVGVGVTCSNCYAYLGVYAYVVMEYWNANFFLLDYGNMAFEAKLYGSMGYNIDLSLSNPSVSSSEQFTLVSAAPSSSATSIPLGADIYLSTYTGGLQLVLSGSGSASGTADFGTGASATAYAGVGYQDISNDYGWTFPSDAEFSVVSPYFDSDISSASISINAELIGTQNFNLGYWVASVEWLGTDFSLSLMGNVDFQGTIELESFVSLSISPSEVSASTTASSRTLRSRNVGHKMFENDEFSVPNTVKPLSSSVARKLTTEVSSSEETTLTVHVGDSVMLDVTIEGFNPLEETVLFFTLHHDQEEYQPSDTRVKQEVPLFSTKFVVPTSGAAVISVSCPVPWDTRIANILAKHNDRTAVLSVRASNKVKDYYYSRTKLLIVADAKVDSIISFSDSAMKTLPPLTLPENSVNISLAWTAKHLRFFQPRHSSIGLGKIIEPSDVQIIAVVDEYETSTSRLLRSQKGTLQNAQTPNYRANRYASYANTHKLVFENTGDGVASWPPSQWTTTYVVPDYDSLPADVQRIQTSHLILEVTRLKNLWGWSPSYIVESSSAVSSSTASLLLLHSEKRQFVSSRHATMDNGSFMTSVTKNDDSMDMKDPALSPSSSRALQSCSASSCVASLTSSVMFSGAMANVIVCDLTFSMGLSTDKITLLAPACVCLYDESSYYSETIIATADKNKPSVHGTTAAVLTIVDNDADDDASSTYYGQLRTAGDSFSSNTVVEIKTVTTGDDKRKSISTVQWLVIGIPLGFIVMFLAIGVHYRMFYRHAPGKTSSEAVATISSMEMVKDANIATTNLVMASPLHQTA